ncbi:MAG: LysM peptidoglycan-binding domain-containing protein [Deltaproteobacteria bacterium]|nr:LysM peptidoglycan-binding domain-containing protein [Deltaproteobacteria bacterium]
MFFKRKSIDIKIKLAFFVSFLLALTGCMTDSYLMQSDPLSSTAPISAEQPPPVSTVDEKGETQTVMTMDDPQSHPITTETEGSPPPPEKGQQPAHVSEVTVTKSSQELLDSALEFCNASNDFWERGDLDNAVDALDEAYSLILQIKPDQPPEILQQRDDLRYTISQRVLQVYSSRFTVVNGYHKAIPLDMNKDVEKALRLLKGKERDFFIAAYRRSGRYRPAIVKALKEAGLPEELSWLPLIESGFKVNALSRARALGMWQFIASTGYKYGLKRGQWVDERMDPEKSTQAAIAYLKELHQIFGDWQTVLAAYNCGEGRVLRCINAQKVNYLDHFWDLYKRLPSETAFYVPKFLAVLHILNDPKAHGFTLPPVDEEIQTEVVTINKQVSLKTMAQHIGMSYELLHELNPSLRRKITPPRPYDLKVPAEKWPVLLAKLDNIPQWRPPPVPVRTYVTHRVRRGETLSSIARRYGTSVRSIMASNHLRSSRYIKTGWRLKIRTRTSYASAARQKPVPKASSRRETPRSGKSSVVKYRVRKGDSLWKIAHRFKTTTQEIQTLNGLRNSRLKIGQVLVIAKASAKSPSVGMETYKVMKGDSPYIIAQKHRMDLADLLRMNRLTPRSTIFPGQILIVQNQ